MKKREGGFCKLCKLSPQLQQFFGVSEMARTEVPLESLVGKYLYSTCHFFYLSIIRLQVVKQIWIYIREKNLQDPSNRRNIICDETLCALFGVDSINMFEMNKVLSNHIWSIYTDKGMLLSFIWKFS